MTTKARQLADKGLLKKNNPCMLVTYTKNAKGESYIYKKCKGRKGKKGKKLKRGPALWTPKAKRQRYNRTFFFSKKYQTREPVQSTPIATQRTYEKKIFKKKGKKSTRH